MSAHFHYVRRGRRPANVAGLICVCAVFLALVLINSHPLFLGLAALPAFVLCIELYRDVHSHLSLSDTGLSWGRGGKDSHIGFDDIDEIRMLRRLDFSHVVELRLARGQKFRLPYDVTPPMKSFESALRARGVQVSQHFFSFF
jgi:hypothetical protein